MSPYIKQKIKDSVFVSLFNDPKNVLELYHAIHPEDTTVTLSDIRILTIQRILSNGIYNDLGFIVRNETIILVESQSTVSANISLRMLIYSAKTYSDYIVEKDLKIHNMRSVDIPYIENYVVQFDDSAPDAWHLSDLMPMPRKMNWDWEVKVLKETEEDNILNQYIQFCKIAKAQTSKFGRSKDVLEKITDICVKENVLRDFMESRRKEIADMLYDLFDQVEVTRQREQKIREEATEEGIKQGIEQGMKQGREEGVEQGILRTVRAMMQNLNLTVDQALAAAVPEDEREKYRILLLKEAESQDF